MNNKLNVDPYTKTVLTVIAVCLVWLCLANAGSVAPLRAQADEPVDVRIRAVDRQADSRWDPLNIRSDETLPAKVVNEDSIPVVIVNGEDELVPVDIRHAVVKESTVLDRK